MKYVQVFVVALAVTALAGCNMQNNGETPPPHELPAPYPTHSAPPAADGTPDDSSSAAPAASAPMAATAAPGGVYTYDGAKGQQLYAATCSVCHQPTGVGISGTFPPLKGNPVVTNADPTGQILTVLNGAQGAKTILGVKYNGVMPPFGSNLSNEDVANLINWERSSWGNHAKHATPAQVAAVRSKAKSS